MSKSAAYLDIRISTDPPPPQKFCVNCEHHGHNYAGPDYCRGSNVIDLVTGQPERIGARAARQEEAKCGASGKWFVEKIVYQHVPQPTFWQRLIAKFRPVNADPPAYGRGYPPLPRPLPPPPQAPPAPPNIKIRKP